MSHNILIIDDDHSLVATLQEGLEASGYKVAAAYDGIQGVLKAQKIRPDLVILDFHMPGGDGVVVYERLRQAPETANIPIVFSTVVSVDEVKGRIKPSAKTYFLRKPAGLGQVVSVIRSILGAAAAVGAPAEGASAKAGPAAAPAPAGAVKFRFHDFALRVTYADTDRMGVVYYANYLRFFEQGRTELLRSLGARYRDLELKRKIYLPVSEAFCRYAAPCRYDDLLLIRTWVLSLGKASMEFVYEVLDAENAGRRIAMGRTRHPLIDESWKPVRLPDDLRASLSPFLGPEPAGLDPKAATK